MRKRILKVVSLMLCCAFLTSCSKAQTPDKTVSENHTASLQSKVSSQSSIISSQNSSVASQQKNNNSKNTATNPSNPENSSNTTTAGSQETVIASSEEETTSTEPISSEESTVSDTASTEFVPTLPNDRLAVPDYDSQYPQRRTTQYHYKSDTLKIGILQYKTAENNLYWLAHVVIASPDQIKGGLANDTYGGFERPTDASKRLDWVLGINGSYFDWSTGKPKGERPVIKQGYPVGTTGSVTTGNEICLLADGTLFSPEKGLTDTDLLDMGVIESWTTYDPLMISDGIKRRTEVINPTHPVGSKNYPRTAIGMVKPCEYYIIVAGDLTANSGISFVKMQEVFYNLGCVYARSFDGGGSSSLVFNDTLVNLPKDGVERAVVDFLYFTE